MDKYSLHLGDCLEFMKSMPDKSVDAVITDPPYPCYNSDHGKQWEYVPIEKIYNLTCKYLIFWPADREFPFLYSAMHIWVKPNGQSNLHYELIYELNGNQVYRVFRVPIINYETLPEWTPHPSQKPERLMRQLIQRFTKRDDTIFDPFMGSGTTGVACMQLGRNFIGCEIDPKYYAIAEKRIHDASLQPQLFTEPKHDEEKQDTLI